MADAHRTTLFLVKPFSKPQPKPQLDSSDIASETIAVVREVTETLALYQKQHDRLMSLVYSTVEALECAALRAKIAQQTKAGE